MRENMRHENDKLIGSFIYCKWDTIDTIAHRNFGMLIAIKVIIVFVIFSSIGESKKQRQQRGDMHMQQKWLA